MVGPRRKGQLSSLEPLHQDPCKTTRGQELLGCHRRHPAVLRAIKITAAKRGTTIKDYLHMAVLALLLADGCLPGDPSTE